MRNIFFACIALILMGTLIPVGFSSDSDSVVITYGETTVYNSEYKDIVNNYFADNANINVANTNNKVFTAKNVNDLFNSFTNQSYSIDQIHSSCLVDVNDDRELDINVDSSKITLITDDMYKSALVSAGIDKGVVYITSPINVSGVNALSEVLDSYESVTNMEMPDNVKIAANREIYVQAEIVKNSNITPENLTKLVSAVKDKVNKENLNNHTEIVKIINKNIEKNNLNMSDSDIENLASTIEEVHSGQNDANNYRNELSEFFSGSKITGESSPVNINNLINSV